MPPASYGNRTRSRCRGQFDSGYDLCKISSLLLEVDNARKICGRPVEQMIVLAFKVLIEEREEIRFHGDLRFAIHGRGTPAPVRPPTRLVVTGLYRYVRNPMYVGVLLVIVGWTVLIRSRDVAIYGASVAMAFHLFVVFVEEPMLRAQFGESYGMYCRSVSRWWPRLRA